MRWEAPVLLDGVADTRPRIERTAVTRVHGGLTCYEVRARTALERVGAGWSVSPYRGCAHACRHCAVRRGHRRLGFGCGGDFDSRIVVRTDIARRLRVELASRWDGGPVVVGVGGDCYQEAEGVYRLMPGVVAALGEAGASFTVRTRSTLILRDAGALADAGASVTVAIAFVDERVRRTVEPGAPAAQRRLEVVAELGGRGVACGVAMAPVLPLVTDSPDQLAATVRRVARAGAVGLVPDVLRLPPGAREWYMAWLGEHHPGLVGRYAGLYGAGSVADPGYVRRVVEEVRGLAARYGLSPVWPPPAGPAGPAGAQLALL
ncbi:radical SAM protein [Streptosporangium violaceochromogenes]|nr:radical SAM protein [Streptosporangium violaceochromogenes]